ncbi:MAG TPA: hypothetical protein VF533_13600 [Solirubrobacteraceae bacterium]
MPIEQAGRNCPYCRFALKAGIPGVECGACHAVHHAECWDENRGCAVVGCVLGPSAQPAPQAVAAATGSAPWPGGPPAPAVPPASQQPWAAPPPPPPPPPPPGLPLATPSAAEFTDRLATWARTPAAVAVGTAALTAAGIMLGVGLLVAVLTPQNSLLGAYGLGIFKETMRDAVGTTMARYGGDGFKSTVLPVTFVLVPVLAVAFGVRRSVGRLPDVPGAQRLLLAMATGVPLAFMLLLLAVLASDDGIGFSAGTVIAFALLWSAVGGALGITRATGSGPWLELTGRAPAGVRRWLGLVATALRPLAVLLAVSAVIGVACWEAQIIRGQTNGTYGRATATAVAETPFFAGQYAIQLTGLGMFAQFQPGGGEGGFVTAIPPNDTGRVSGFIETYRITGYHRAIPFALYVFLLILLPGAAVLLALYSGYATALAAGARTAGMRAAFGASTGAVWALALVLLRWIGGERALVGDSLFVSALLLGAVAGALGGLLSAVRSRTPPQGAPPT